MWHTRKTFPHTEWYKRCHMHSEITLCIIAIWLLVQKKSWKAVLTYCFPAIHASGQLASSARESLSCIHAICAQLAALIGKNGRHHGTLCPVLIMHPCSQRNDIWKTFLSWDKVLFNQTHLQTIHRSHIIIFVCFTPLSIHRVYITADHFSKAQNCSFKLMILPYLNSQSIKTCLTREPAVVSFSVVNQIKTIRVKKPSRSVLSDVYENVVYLRIESGLWNNNHQHARRDQIHMPFNDIHVCFSCFFPGRNIWQHSSESKAVRQQSLKSGIL